MTRSYFRPMCRAVVEVVFDGRGAPNSKPFYLEVNPRSATVGLNGFYEADTWMLEFDSKILPFDPDQIAYCAVRIYMWDGISHSGEWAVDSNLIVRGLLDDAETSIVGEDNFVKFVGRDYTAILVDPEWDPKQRIQTGGNLVDVVQSIADQAAPEGTRARFEVVWEGEDDPPICGASLRSTKKKGLWVKPGKKYWDVIWDLCIQHAYVPRIEGAKIIISEPITQTRQSLTQAPRLVYGKTLTSLQVKRKFSHETVPQIVIIAYDPITKKKFEVKYPEKRNRVQRVTAQRDQPTDALGVLLASKKDEQMYFPAPKGIIDKKTLERYARMRFYHIGRGETIYSFETNHFIIDGQEGNEINLLGLRPGNAIGIAFDPFNREHLRSLEFGQRASYIQNLGYHYEIANFIASNIDALELFKQDYYLNRADVSYSIEEALTIRIEAVNFASEIREVHFNDRRSITADRLSPVSGRNPGTRPPLETF